MAERVIYLERAAPPKPEPGAPCNGCGVCCAADPCPLGILASRRLRGACAALRWDAAERRYHCGIVQEASGLTRRLALRWIGAARGCDCDHEASELR